VQGGLEGTKETRESLNQQKKIETLFKKGTRFSGPFLIYFTQFGVLFKLTEMARLRRSIKEDQLNRNSVGRIRRSEQIVVDEITLLGALSRRVTLGPHSRE
jgi:hypothetical protein